jgi:fatty-acyl-CoA synthase
MEAGGKEAAVDVASEPSYVHGASPVPLLGETIGQNLDRTAARVPDNDALVSVHQGVRMTYAQLHAAVEEVARGLLALGIEPGERVGIWSPNNAEWVTLQYATAKAGAILVNINPAYRTSELAYALGQSGVSTLVLAPRFRQADYLGMLDQVAGDLPALERRVVLGPEVPAGAVGWDELREGAGRVPVERLREREALLQFDDPINIQYTSGTTGFPKGAPRPTGSASRCRCTTASAWCSATWPAPPTGRRWSTRPRRSSPRPPWPPSRPSAAPRCTGCRRCSSPSWSIPASATST